MLTAFLFRRVFPEMIPIEVLLFGGIMLVIIVLIHGAGLDRIVTRYKRKADMLRAKSFHPHLATYIFAGAILLMLLLHVTEACIWGVVLNRVGLIGNLRDSIYFSANTYTTIGYGIMILPQDWSSVPLWRFPACSRLHGQRAKCSTSFTYNTISSKSCRPGAARRRARGETRTTRLSRRPS
jgi:ion channel